MRLADRRRLPVSVQIALRGLTRRPVRAAITTSAIAFGVVALILSGGFVNDILSQLAEAVIRSQSGHIQVARTGGFAAAGSGDERLLISRPGDVKRAVDDLAGVDFSMARLNFSGVLSNGRRDLPVLGEGIEPDAEARLGTYLRVAAGRRLESRDESGAMLGEGLAAGLAVQPGDRVTLLTTTVDGATNSADLEVVGIFRTFSREYDARAVRIKLESAQELLGANGAHRVVVALARTADTEAAAAQIQALAGAGAFEVQTWRQLNDFFAKTEQLYRQQFGALRFIVLVMVLLSVTNNLNLIIFERTSEFGTMRALGNRGDQIFSQIMVEAALLGLLGALAGVVVGCGFALLISQAGIPMPPPPNANEAYVARIGLSAATVGSAALIGFLATLTGALIPAIRVARMPIHEALRRAGA